MSFPYHCSLSGLTEAMQPVFPLYILSACLLDVYILSLYRSTWLVQDTLHFLNSKFQPSYNVIRLYRREKTVVAILRSQVCSGFLTKSLDSNSNNLDRNLNPP